MVVAQPLPHPSPPSLLLLSLSLSLPLSPSLSSRPFLRSSLADRTNEPLLIRRLLLLLRLLLLVSFLSSFSRQFTSASKYSQRLKTGQQKRREPRFSIFPRLPRIRRSCTDHFGIPRMVQSIPGISRGLRTANFLPTSKGIVT